MIEGRLGCIQRLTASEWQEWRRHVSHPERYEDGHGLITYYGGDKTLFVGPGRPMKALASLLEVEDMEEANEMIDGWKMARLTDRDKDTIATWIGSRLHEEWTMEGLRQAAEWIQAHYSRDQRDLLDDQVGLPTAHFLQGLLKLGGHDAVYMAGYLDGKREKDMEKSKDVWIVTAYFEGGTEHPDQVGWVAYTKAKATECEAWLWREYGEGGGLEDVQVDGPRRDDPSLYDEIWN